MISKPPINTSDFIELLSQHGNKAAIQALTANELKQLESCADNTITESLKGIGAVGQLIYWSCQIDEPMNDCLGHAGLLVASVSELILKADFVRSEASYQLNKTNP